MKANEEDFFFVYCDIIESISDRLAATLGISSEDLVVHSIGILEEYAEKMEFDVPKDIKRFLKDIFDIIKKIREAYHIHFNENKIEERGLWKLRKTIREYLAKIERRIGKIESLIEIRGKKERIELRNEIKKIQGIKKTIKEFNDSLEGINSISWEAGLSKTTISITPKKGRKFYVAKTKLFDLAVTAPLDIVIAINRRNVSIIVEENGLFFDFFSIPFIKQIFAFSISIDDEKGVDLKGVQKGKEIHINVKRKEKKIHIDFQKNNENVSTTLPI
jgi:hypothetical protein